MQVMNGNVASDRRAVMSRTPDHIDAFRTRQAAQMHTRTGLACEQQNYRQCSGLRAHRYRRQAQPCSYLTVMRDTVAGKRGVLRA